MIDIHNTDCINLLKNIPDNYVDLIVTDPPYELTKAGGGVFGFKGRAYHAQIENMRKGFDISVLGELIRVCKAPNFYIWGSWPQIIAYSNYFNENLDNILIQLLTWHKSNPMPSCKNHYLADTEYCLYVKGKGVAKTGGYHESRTYWVTPTNTADKSRWNHPTIKPEKIISQLIQNSSKEGDIVLDPYSGSGTTAYCCKQLNRSFIGSEINESYWLKSLERVGINPPNTVVYSQPTEQTSELSPRV